jgi:hypothetical protein
MLLGPDAVVAVACVKEGGDAAMAVAVAVGLLLVATAEKEIMGELCGREGTTGTWALMKIFIM